MWVGGLDGLEYIIKCVFSFQFPVVCYFLYLKLSCFEDNWFLLLKGQLKHI